MAQTHLDAEQAVTLAPEEPAPTLGLKAGVLLFALAMAVLLPGIHVSFFDRDEGWYAQVCREMLASGDWLMPRYLGEAWIAKPPLTYWLVTASYWLFGVVFFCTVPEIVALIDNNKIKFAPVYS